MTLTKFAIIGYGSMGSVHHKSISEIDNIILHSVLDTDKKKLKKINNDISVFDKFNEFIDHIKKENVDGVIISSPNQYHYEQAKELINNNIPVLIEKPLTESIDNLNSLLKKAEENNTVLRCGLIEIYNPIISELKKTKFKNLKSIHITRHSPRVSNDRNLGDVIFDLLLHDISLLFDIFNPIDLEIVGFNKFDLNGEIETFEILLSIDNKTSVFISTSRESQVKKRNIEIIDKDTIYFIDLIQKIIYVTRKGSLTRDNKSFTEKNQKFKIEPLDRPETAKIQLRKFQENIDSNKIDKKHFELIRKSHDFIFKIA